MYTTQLKLDHNEIPAKINIETGEIKEIRKHVSNLPDGKSKLDYKRFHMKNDRLASVARDTKLLTYEDLGIIDYMCTISEMGTNSLKPLNSDTPTTIMVEKFGIDKRRIKPLFENLFKLGVYLEITYYSAREDREVTYWVLNPYISWKGRIKDDSMFNHFDDCIITRLIK